jgi:hypothetical protein
MPLDDQQFLWKKKTKIHLSKSYVFSNKKHTHIFFFF